MKVTIWLSQECDQTEKPILGFLSKPDSPELYSSGAIQNHSKNFQDLQRKPGAQRRPARE